MVSLNSIMVDGTGMCGSCRVTVGGKMRFACVDGPEFDGAEVDFDELIARSRSYVEQERIAEQRAAGRICAAAEQARAATVGPPAAAERALVPTQPASAALVPVATTSERGR